MIGTTLSHYRILEKIGEGGMGVVYKARDTQLERLVAIKVLPADKVANEERKLRFAQEARSASALNHPNIIRIYEIGSVDGTDFIVMEFVAGRTLDHLIPRGGMKVADVLKVAIPVADALARAHAAGIVHRDLKPGNIMVAEDGQVKLLDFGLAKLSDLHATSDAELTRAAAAATEVGSIVGTVSYMSPEQAEARRVDARSDIFSFGAVLYEMVTGQRAFLGRSKISTLAAVLQSDPLVATQIQPGVPKELRKIIQRCLRKDPAWRYQSAADLKILLHDLQQELESGEAEAQAAPVPARRTAPTWIAVAAVGVVVVAGVTWLLASRVGRGPASAVFVKPLTTYAGLEYEPALSPDGKQVAFSWNGEKKDNFDIYVRLVDGGSALRVTTDPAPDHAPAWSPDGGRLAYFRGRAIYVVPALGGMERRLAQVPNGSIFVSALSWSPDGKLLAFSGSQDSSPASIWIASTESGEMRRASTPPKGYQYDISPAFSPDGRTLAFIRARDSYSRAVVLQKLDANGTADGTGREATGYEKTLQDLAWDWDGKSLIVSVQRSLESHNLWRLTPGGSLQPVTMESDDVRWPSVSHAGKRLAYEKRRTDHNIYRIDGPGPDGGPRSWDQLHATPVADSTAIDREPMLSPDGRRFVFNSNRTGYNEIHVAAADGANQVALTAMGPTGMGSPRWSPDGQTVVFDRYEDGHSSIYAVSVDGGKPRRMTGDSATDIRPSFSRDAQWIYFASNRTGRMEIWKIPSAGGTPQQVTRNGGNEPFESPDGKLLYYMSGETGLWAIPTSGGDAKLVLPEASFPLYAAAGKSVYYAVRNPASIWVLRTDTGRKFEYVRFPDSVIVFSGGGTGFSVSADERTILYSQTDRRESDLMLLESK